MSPPPGFATGWFVVAAADELPVGKVLSMKYFGQKLVAFRGDSGAVSVLDAPCGFGRCGQSLYRPFTRAA